MKKHNAPISYEKSIFSHISKEDNKEEDIDVNELFDCLCVEECEPEGACYICDHKYDCICAESQMFDCGVETPFYNGALELLYAGCTYFYHLILNGPFRGEVWLSDENDKIMSVEKSFKKFLRRICTEAFL